MTDREKLTELIDYFCEHMPHEEGQTWEAACADYLIANGVTFATDTNVGSKWIKADQPPEDWKGEGGYLTNYYVYTPEYGVDIGNYMKPANKWLCMGIPCNVTHWMPLPEPPKTKTFLTEE